MWPTNDRSLVIKVDTWTGTASSRQLVAAPGAGKQIQLLSVLASYRPSSTEYVDWFLKSGTTATTFVEFTTVPNSNVVHWEGIAYIEANESLVVSTTVAAGTPTEYLTIIYRICGTGFE